MNGVPELLLVDEEAVRLSVRIRGESGIAVAGEAILVFELVLCWKG